MTNDDVRQAAERVFTQLAGANGPAGFISADVAILRADHAERMMRAEQIIAENARIVAALPQRRPAPKKSPARARLEQKITKLSAKAAEINLALQLESFRRTLNALPHTN